MLSYQESQEILSSFVTRPERAIIMLSTKARRSMKIRYPSQFARFVDTVHLCFDSSSW